MSALDLPSSGLAIPQQSCHVTYTQVCQSNCDADIADWVMVTETNYACVDGNAVCNEETFACIPADQSVLSCSGEDDCLDGFRCDVELQACVIDGTTDSFACSGGDSEYPEIGGECESQWVVVDEDANIWRIWWPHRESPPSGGTVKVEFAALIGEAGGEAQDLDRLHLLINSVADYDSCDENADVTGCVKDLCSDWDGWSYAEQQAHKIQELVAEDSDVPVGYWAPGLKWEMNEVSVESPR